MRYLVERLPTIMEDEGRSFFYGIFATKEEAERLVTEECKSYWTVGDFVIREVD